MEKTLSILLHHDGWATRELIEYCRCLTADELDRPFEMGPGSVRKTLEHIVGAMATWADRIAVDPAAPRRTAPPAGSLDDLLQLCKQAATSLVAAGQRDCDQDRLDQIMAVRPAGHPEYRFTRAAALVHVATHGMHHRAQVFNMLRRMGKPIGRDLDPIDWELAQAAG